MGRSVKDLEAYIKEAIDNIRDDRDITSTLLTQVFAEITNGQETHKDLGLIAAKYVETLQRSNEQLVKLTSIMAKKGKKIKNGKSKSFLNNTSTPVDSVP